jgi:hypothetical protein
MRILVLMNRKKGLNIAPHGLFLAYLQNIEDVYVKYYGPHTKGVTGLNIIPYDRKNPTSVLELENEHEPDIVILYRAGRKDLRWLDLDAIRQLRAIKVIIDTDFMNIKDSDKFCEVADLHLFRFPELMQYSRCEHTAALPCSFDPNIYHGSFAGRSGICYSGRMGGNETTSFQIRHKAKRLLQADIPSKYLTLKQQADYYRQHLAALTCSTTYKSLGAKHFEIPATGAVLFTNGGNRIEDYLPDGTYVKYKSDCSDVCEKWAEVQANKSHWQSQAYKALKHVHNNHTHAHRWEDFFKLINKYF